MNDSQGNESFDDEFIDKTNLIVNYLPQEFTDEEFVALFEQIGHVKNGRIIRNKQTNYSYGFGFIQYFKKEDAMKAIERLNGYQIRHKRIKVAVSRPQCSDIKQAKLYIKNIPTNYSEEQISQIFSKYGKIIQCRLVGGEVNHKGIAFILYDLHDQAEKAMMNLNGVQLSDTSLPLEIKYASDNKNQSWNDRGQKNYRDMYRNFDYNDPLNYPDYFNSGLMGPIRNIQNSKSFNRYNPFNNPYMRMNFDNGESSRNYMNINNANTNNMQNPVGAASGSRVGDYVLFVYNIGSQTDEDTLGTLFSKVGHVIKTQVIRKGAESRGFGFVTMATYEDAVNAISSLNGFVFRGKSLQVNFKQ